MDLVFLMKAIVESPGSLWIMSGTKMGSPSDIYIEEERGKFPNMIDNPQVLIYYSEMLDHTRHSLNELVLWSITYVHARHSSG